MPNTKPNIFNKQAVSAEAFLKEYWQQRPLLFRQTGIPLDGVPNKTELFSLAAQEGVQSRIIYSPDGQRYFALYDEPEAWSEVQQQQPTLLVSDIDKWWPKSLNILSALPFIKAWRFDDLMLSYAPTGASVGAHIDQYDVFLVQVKGRRRWSFDDQPLTELETVDDSDLAVLKDYKPQHTVDLSAGDILYLPPRIPHHGVSLNNDCLTLSIGLRAPSAAELITAVADQWAQQLPESERLQDAGNEINATAAITVHEINYLRQQLQRLQDLTDVDLADILGQFLSGYRLLDEVPDPSAFNQASINNKQWRKNPVDNFSYYLLDSNQAHLYLNGEIYPTSQRFAQYLCDQSALNSEQLTLLDDHDLVSQLINGNHLIRT